MYIIMLVVAVRISCSVWSACQQFRHETPDKLMGNIVFWIGLYAGFPLLCVGEFTNCLPVYHFLDRLQATLHIEKELIDASPD